MILLNFYGKREGKMIDNSFSYCINKKCNKKESCLRFKEKENIDICQTYLDLNEEECLKYNCYIEKNNYYKKFTK